MIMDLSSNPIGDFLDETCRLLQRLDPAAIARARDLLLDCYRRGGRVFTLGNGGSASTAQHFACDLAKFVIPPGQRPFDVRCLTDNVSLYTAWANDADRADVFVNLMRGLLQAGDVVLACSVHGGTGFSADLVRAVVHGPRVHRVNPCAGSLDAPGGGDSLGHRTLAHGAHQAGAGRFVG
jgi:D-sedoheptulose 7-phosphate isomerase